MNIREIIKKLTVITSAYATLITVKSYHEEKESVILLKKRLNENIELTNRVGELWESNMLLEANQNNIKDRLDEILQQKTLASENHSTLLERIQEYELNKTEDTWAKVSTSAQESSESLGSLVEKVETTKNFLENFKSGGNNLIPFDNFTDFISNYQLLLEQLTQSQKFAIIHILLSFIILLCLINMIGLFLGDQLIKYFKLEERFPKLAKIIQLRRKFLTYYFLFDSLLIILALFVIVGFNIYNIL